MMREVRGLVVFTTCKLTSTPMKVCFSMVGVKSSFAVPHASENGWGSDTGGLGVLHACLACSYGGFL